MVIAIDGPSASGKGILAHYLGKRLGFAVLDTGILYRSIGLLMLLQGKDSCDSEVLQEAARHLTFNPFIFQDHPNLRSEVVALAASQSAFQPEVRSLLLDIQRSFITNPPDRVNGVVLDGRDISTVVWPDADAKLFLTASIDVRATRRFNALQKSGKSPIFDTIFQNIKERDQRDQNRSLAPLKAADDAFFIDTSALTIEQVFACTLSFLQTKPSFVAYLTENNTFTIS